jgi:hypothetical protein
MVQRSTITKSMNKLTEMLLIVHRQVQLLYREILYRRTTRRPRADRRDSESSFQTPKPFSVLESRDCLQPLLILKRIYVCERLIDKRESMNEYPISSLVKLLLQSHHP